MQDQRALSVNAIDLRHRNWIELVLKSGRFKRVLEIGSFAGFSTESFWNALDTGAIEEVVLVEPFPQSELMVAAEAAAKRHPDKVSLYQMYSVDFLKKDTAFDFVFVDSLHTTENTFDELRYLLLAGIDCLAFHDTSAAGRIVGCFGPQYGKRAYQREGYFVTEDSLVREGERTDRGLVMAAKTLETHRIVVDAYKQIS